MDSPRESKRSLFTPIMLILLVISLIGNVFFYSQYLHGTKEKRVEEGSRIIRAGWDTKLHFGGILDNVRLLLDSGDDMGKRIAAKQGIVDWTGYAEQVQAFVWGADGRNGREPLTFERRNALTFVSQVEASLKHIGTHGGPLTVKERRYLLSIEKLYSTLSEIAEGFTVDTINDSQAQLVLSGGDWVDAAYDLAAVMDREEQMLFEGVKDPLLTED
ncbi:hypothetical protein PATA110616_03990 [Paenibacillus tarimensis]